MSEKIQFLYLRDGFAEGEPMLLIFDKSRDINITKLFKVFTTLDNHFTSYGIYNIYFLDFFLIFVKEVLSKVAEKLRCEEHGENQSPTLTIFKI